MPDGTLELVATLRNNTGAGLRSLKDGLADIERESGKTSKGLSGITSALGSVGKLAGGFVVAEGLMKLPGVFADMGQQSAQLELQTKKASIVFGEQIGVVNQWAAANAASMGLTKNEATGLAAGLADLLVPMGMTREAATDMSTKTIGLAGALAEWTGGQKSAADVADILSAAFMGERDGLNALGISITAAEVEARLLQKGQQDLTGTALQQAEALATQELIFEKSADAQKAFAEGAGTAARKTAENTAKMKEAKEELSNALAPAFLKVTEAISVGLPVAIAFGRDVAGGAKEVGQALAPLAGAMQSTFGFLADHEEVLIGVGAAITAGLVPGLIAWTGAQIALTTAQIAGAAAFVAANAPLIAIAAGVGAVGAGIVLLIKHWDDITEKFPILGTVSDGVESSLRALWGFLTNDFGPGATAVFDAVTGAGGKVLDFARDHWKEIATLLSGPFAPLVLLATDAFGVRSALEGALSGIKTFAGERIGETVAFFTSIPGALTELPAQMETAGRNIVSGLWNGIASLRDWIFGQVKAFAQGIYNEIKDGFGKLWPFSPSEAGIDIGLGLTSGIELGIQLGLPDAVAAASALSTAVQAAAGAGVGAGMANAPASAFTPGAAIDPSKAAWADPHTDFFGAVSGYFADVSGGLAMPRNASRRIKFMAGGGLITEPVVGLGLRTGTPHVLGERGVERVTPGAGGGGITINVNVQGNVVKEKDLARSIYDEFTKFSKSNPHLPGLRR